MSGVLKRRSNLGLGLFAALVAAVLIMIGLTVGCLRNGAAPTVAALDSEKSADSAQWFKDVTSECGLDFVHDAGPTGAYFMPQSVGSGAALFDFDNDGRLGILLLQNGGPESGSTNRLYRQLPDGRFQDVSAGCGLDYAGYCMGVAVGDVNNDGWPDVLITEYGRVRLFLNNGNGTFADVSEEAGLTNPHWGTSAAFVDYDRDGWLDLVVVNYINYESFWCGSAAGKQDFCGPKGFSGSVTKLFHNLGRQPAGNSARVRFEDVTLKAGLNQSPGPGLGVFCADFNGDGWPDIFIANDGQPNHLWINQRDGTFKEEALKRGLALNAMGQAEANMGIGVGDVDGDGLFDVFVTHLSSETHRLWRQKSRGMFRDETKRSGLASPHGHGTGFGTVLADFDHDGAPDLAIVNGNVKRASDDNHASNPAECLPLFWKPYAERNQLLANDGKGTFRDASLENAEFCGTGMVARGLACGDLNGDGALDLLVTNIAAPARLYRNVAPKKGHWLLVRAVDPALKRDAYGAEITVHAGGRNWLRWINPAYSYLCSNDPRAHFGIGEVDRIESIHVLWPDGAEESFEGPKIDSAVVLYKSKGPRVEPAAVSYNRKSQDN